MDGWEIKKTCAMCLKKVGENFMIGRYIRTGTFLRISILFFVLVLTTLYDRWQLKNEACLWMPSIKSLYI